MMYILVFEFLVFSGAPVLACTTFGGNAPNGSACAFPFLLSGQPVYACAPSSPPWCATTSNYDRDKLFTYCNSDCPIFTPPPPPNGVQLPECPVVGSAGAVTTQSCSFPFTYRGHTFNGCTKLDSQDFWCSTTDNYDRDHGWGLCAESCLNKSYIDCGPFTASPVFTYSCPNGTALGAVCTTGCVVPWLIPLTVPYVCQEDGLWHGLAVCIDSRSLNYTNTQFTDLVALRLYKLTRGLTHHNIAVDTHLVSLGASPGALPAGLVFSPFGLDIGGNYAATLLSGRPLVAGRFNSGNGMWAFWNDPRRPSNVTLPPVSFNIFPAMHTGRTILRASVNRSVTTEPSPIFGGRPPVRFELASSSLLPPNCTLNNVTGQLWCVPGRVGNFSGITVFAVDQSSQRIFLEPIDLVVTAPLSLERRPVSIIFISIEYGGAVDFDAGNISLVGGTGSVTYGSRRILPPGLELNPQTGVVSGNVGVAGAYNVTLTATDLLQTIVVAVLRVTVAPRDTSTSSSKDNTLTTALVAGLLAFLAIILFLVLLFVVRRKRENLEPLSFAAELEWMEMQCQGKIVEPRELARNTVRVLETIGRGYFGEVVKGTINEPGSDYPEYLVAIKTIDRHSDAHGLAQFRAEAVLMAQLVHDNVVRLIGVCTSGNPLWIIMQYCEHGSLLSFLRQRTGFNALKMAANLSILADVSSGMAYIAARGIIHRDLAARNVLVASDFTCKISDFGMSRETTESRSYYRIKDDSILPMRWTAPEVLRDSRHTTKSDVWSYGIVMFEVMTAGEQPYGNMDDNLIYTQVIAGMRLARPESCPMGLYDVMLRCWDESPENRPTFEAILAEIRHMQKTGRLDKVASNTSPGTARARRPSVTPDTFHPAYYNLPSGSAAPTGVVYPLSLSIGGDSHSHESTMTTGYNSTGGPDGMRRKGQGGAQDAHVEGTNSGGSGGSGSGSGGSGSQGLGDSPMTLRQVVADANSNSSPMLVRPGPDGSMPMGTVTPSDPFKNHLSAPTLLTNVLNPLHSHRTSARGPGSNAVAESTFPRLTSHDSVFDEAEVSGREIRAPASAQHLPHSLATLQSPPTAASTALASSSLSFSRGPSATSTTEAQTGATASSVTPTGVPSPTATQSAHPYSPRPSLPSLTSPLVAGFQTRPHRPASPAAVRANTLSFAPSPPLVTLGSARASPTRSGSPLSLSASVTDSQPRDTHASAAAPSSTGPVVVSPSHFPRTTTIDTVFNSDAPAAVNTGRDSPLRLRPAWHGADTTTTTTAAAAAERALVTPPSARRVFEVPSEDPSGFESPLRPGRSEWTSVRLPGVSTSGSGTALLDSVESEI